MFVRYSSIVAYIAVAMVVALFTGCDNIAPPYTESGNVDTNTTQEKRVVLLEDFSGVNCVNCPDASRLVKTLVESETYKNRFVPVVIHAGVFARPTKSYHPEFRITEGRAIHDELFDGVGYPMGMVNRKIYNGARAVDYNAWPETIASFFESTPDVGLDLTTSYNTATKELTANANVRFLKDVTEPYNISFYLVENKVIAFQKDGNIENMEYEHNYILRAVFNGTWGEPVTEGTLPKAGASKAVTSTLQMSDAWNPANCKVVAFVHVYSPTGASARQFEVLQAIQKPVQ